MTSVTERQKEYGFMDPEQVKERQRNFGFMTDPNVDSVPARERKYGFMKDNTMAEGETGNRQKIFNFMDGKTTSKQEIGPMFGLL
jgi:hypothetical protein